ncbi:MAG: T9SS type A sorting domain-containing protein [Chitinophagales bacterium]
MVIKARYFLIGLLFIGLVSMTIIDRDGSDSLRVYPQPIKGITKVTSDLEVLRVEVYNILGSKVLDRNGEGDLDFSNLQPGYYIVKASTEKGELIKRVQKN